MSPSKPGSQIAKEAAAKLAAMGKPRDGAVPAGAAGAAAGDQTAPVPVNTATRSAGRAAGGANGANGAGGRAGNGAAPARQSGDAVAAAASRPASLFPKAPGGQGAPAAPAAPSAQPVSAQPAPAAAQSQARVLPPMPPAPAAPAAPPVVAAAGPSVAGGAAIGAGAAAGATKTAAKSAAKSATKQAPARGAKSAPRPAAPAPTGRRVQLTVARVDPWSVMKLSFLVSVAIGIALVIAVAVLWLVLDGMGVFTSVNKTISDIAGDTSSFDLMDYIALPRVMSLAVVVGVVDIVLLTALSTLGAFLYNVCSSLVGGVHLTLSDD